MDNNQTYHLDAPALSTHMNSLVVQAFRELGDSLADNLAFLEIEVLEGEQNCNVRTAYMRIKDKIAENLDNILLRHSLAIIDEIRKEAVFIDTICSTEREF
ncbi:MAG: hypothetical protein COA94_03245 [Rickettsiales bacterium]|nr:MAG: hypothetical protein COA94_03245 [Rickettsiales bacterium]